LDFLDLHFTDMATSQPEWKKKAAAKRAAQYESIPKEWRIPEPLPQPKNTYEYLKASGLLSAGELSITETTDASILLRKIASGKLSAVAVTTAFCHRAALAQQLIRCCTEMFFTEAIESAKRLDDHFKKTGKVTGPLHGLPVSLKDGFDVVGQDSTLGWVSEIGKPAREDAALVKVLRKLGAVVYCKTNIPQSLMVSCVLSVLGRSVWDGEGKLMCEQMSDSYNHIFKQSVNAFHNGLISGGSSGGEGALVGARGSLVGIGTDIGGENGVFVGSISVADMEKAQYVFQLICKDCMGSVRARDGYLGRNLGESDLTL
jgi:amidase